MYKPAGDFNIVRVKNGVYRVYLTHKDAAISCASLSLRYDVESIETDSGVCYEIKAKQPTYVTIRWNFNDQKSINAAEKKKTKYENAGYELIKEYVNSVTEDYYLTYKVK